MEEVEEEYPDPRSALPHTTPNSMVVKVHNSTILTIIPQVFDLGNLTKRVIQTVGRRELIPAHIAAEAMAALHGLGLRWSVPITPTQRQYSHGLIGENDRRVEERRPSPSPSLEPSRLLDLLTSKSSFTGNFISVPEIQARNRVLQHCGLAGEDYFALFMPTRKAAMMLVGEGYPFRRYKYYMTAIEEEADGIREFAADKEAKVIPAPAGWLDLRIKGSQLSQYFRRKSKHGSKGLFAYPAAVLGTRHSMHWISEARRNWWHVLLDAASIAAVGQDRLSLALHRPDFVLCAVQNWLAGPPADMACLLVRKKAFDASG